MTQPESELDAAAGGRLPGLDTDSFWRADRPSIAAERAQASAYVDSYSSDKWSLAALGKTDGGRVLSLNFGRHRPRGRRDRPAAFIETRKRIGYLLINRPTPPELLDRRWSNAVEWPSASTVVGIMSAIDKFLDWCAGREVAALADCTTSLLLDYQQSVVTSDVRPGTKLNQLRAVQRVHLMAAELPADDRLCAPPWDVTDYAEGISTVSGEAAGSKRAVISAATMDLLLHWSEKFVRDLSRDIISAVRDAAHIDASMPARPEGRSGGAIRERPHTDAAHTFLLGYLDRTGGALPGIRGKVKPGVAWTYLGGRYGHHWQVLKEVSESRRLTYRVDVDMALPLATPVTAVIGDQPWTDSIEYRDAMRPLGHHKPRLLRVLEAACLISVSYLSGMRPEEALSLRRGCLEVVPPLAPAGPFSYLLHGRVVKGRTVRGKRKIDGEDAVWVTIGPGADAVRVAEQISINEFLFSAVNGRAGPIGTALANERINDFIDYVNGLVTARRLPTGYLIPDDPSGPVTVSRFRRTVAWHFDHQPDGELALGLQYQHAGTSIGRNGYASAAHGGARQMMSPNQAAAHSETLREVGRALTNGAGVSGPAAERLIQAAELQAPVRARFVTSAEGRAIIRDSHVRVFDNPSAHSLCVFDPGLAKCAPEGDEPDRGTCSADCANHARTDIHIDRLRDERDRHVAESESPLTPEPLKVALMRRAAAEQQMIDDHESTKLVPGTQQTRKA